MAENFDLIFGQNASQQYAWNDTDYEKGWETIGNIPPTAAQFDALQRRNDTKMKVLNDELTPLVNVDTADSRQPSTDYSVDDIKYSPLLPTGWYLLCTTAGTTSASDLVITSPTVGNTVTDGTVTWKIRKVASTADIPAPVDISGKANINGSNMVYHKDVITTSGSYTVPATGLYKITIKGGGGGGAGGSLGANATYGGGGGAEGGTTIAYTKLTAGQSCSVTIGAGGSGGAAKEPGSSGGSTSVTISGSTYTAGGGGGGSTRVKAASSSAGGTGTIPGHAANNTQQTYNGMSWGESGAGAGGGGHTLSATAGNNGTMGGGGSGGGAIVNSSTYAGGRGGSGYVWFEYYTA